MSHFFIFYLEKSSFSINTQSLLEFFIKKLETENIEYFLVNEILIINKIINYARLTSGFSIFHARNNIKKIDVYTIEKKAQIQYFYSNCVILFNLFLKLYD
jgi:hypothetical protein